MKLFIFLILCSCGFTASEERTDVKLLIKEVERLQKCDSWSTDRIKDLEAQMVNMRDLLDSKYK